MTATPDSTNALSLRIPSKVQKAIVHDDDTLVLELFAGDKQWLVVQHGVPRVSSEKPGRASDDAPASKQPPTSQAVWRKEAVPSALSAVTHDDARGLWRLVCARGDVPARVLVVETDARDPRWLLLAVTDDGERVLTSGGAARARDGRDVRRGRLYEPPREAPRLTTTRTDAPASSDHAAARDARATTSDDPRIAVRARLKAEARRLQRLVDALQRDLVRHGDPARLQEDGELLKTAMGRVARGSSHVDVTAFDGTPRTLLLDPAVDARTNLARLFARAKRAGSAQALVQPRLVAAQARAHDVEHARAHLHDARTDDEIAAAIEAATTLLAAPETGGSARRQAARAGPRQAWRSFRVSGDVVVRVGRSAKDNDTLVRGARGHDVWLHTRDHVGSHVIIPSSGAVVADDVMLDAATLAAHFSSARGEPRVDIQHTRVKHLRKPGAGAPAGFFTVQLEQVLHLRVDDERVRRLLSREVAASG